jgi:hypothetical protein
MFLMVLSKPAQVPEFEPCLCSCRGASISEHIKLGYACNLMRVIINLTAPNWPRLSPKRESGLVQLALKLRAAIK